METCVDMNCLVVSIHICSDFVSLESSVNWVLEVLFMVIITNWKSNIFLTLLAICCISSWTTRSTSLDYKITHISAGTVWRVMEALSFISRQDRSGSTTKVTFAIRVILTIVCGRGIYRISRNSYRWEVVLVGVDFVVGFHRNSSSRVKITIIK